MNHTGRFFEGITEGAAIAGATFGHSTLIGCVAGGVLSLTGVFVAAATGHNVAEGAQKCGCAAFLAAGGLMAAWNAVHLIKDFWDHHKFPAAKRSGGDSRISYKTVAIGEVATLGALGYFCAPTIESMVRTLVK